MRYTPTLKLSTRLVAVITMVVVSTIFILFIGGALSIQKLGQDYIDHSLHGVVKVIDKELTKQTEPGELVKWIPKLLKASQIIEMELSTGSNVLFTYRDTDFNLPQQNLNTRTFQLTLNPELSVEMKVLPPYIGYGYSLSALSSITIAIGLIVFCLVQAIRWLKVQLIGSELLEERGRMILAGRVEDNATGSSKEWPFTASEALDKLIAELKDARQERSRFDTFIRENTFLDQLTGSANRLLFDNKLESSLQESGANGAVFLLQIDDWEHIAESENSSVRDQLVVSVADVIETLLERYPDAIQSRYYEDMFAIFIPNKGYKEVSQLLNQCLKSLDKISLLPSMNEENWFHIGLTMYQQGERKGRIIEEAEIALKSAQHQRSNNWSRSDKPHSAVEVRGNVRWRTLFDKQLVAEKMELLAQPCFIDSQNNNRMLVHEELFVRIKDENHQTIKASRFIEAVSQVGYEMQLDVEVWKKVLPLLKSSDNQSIYSINLETSPFKHHSHVIWFRDELMQLSLANRQRLCFEFIESKLVQHLDFMRPVLRMLNAMGCKVVVNQVGRTIVSTHYLNDVNVHYLKLHRSLIKRIESRSENQLFIRSLIGASSDTEAKVIAVGIETEKEWSMLLSLGVHGGQGRLFKAEHSLIKGNKLAIEPQKVKAGRRNRWR